MLMDGFFCAGGGVGNIAIPEGHATNAPPFFVINSVDLWC